MQADAVQKKAPWWAWAFVGVCAAIPVAALGGAIPGALGCAGAGACYGIARNGKGSGQRRALLCTLVAFACWTAFAGLILAVHGMAGPKIAKTSTPAPKVSATRALSEPREVVVEKQRVALSSPKPSTARATPVPKLALTKSFTSTPPAPASASVAEDSLSLEERQEIYAKAARRRAMITSSQEALDRRLREGKSTEVHTKQLEHAKGMYEKHLNFSWQFNRISRAELDAIIREGDRAAWPSG